MTHRAERNSLGREVSYYASFEIIRDAARTGRFKRPEDAMTTPFVRPFDGLDDGTVPFVKYSSPYELFDIGELLDRAVDRADPKIAAATLARPVSAPRPPAVTPSGTPPIGTAAIQEPAPCVEPIDATQPFASSSIEDMLASSLVETPAGSSIDDMLAVAFAETPDALGLVETSASGVIDAPEPSTSIECDLQDLSVECELGEPLASDTGELHESDLVPIDGGDPLAGDTLTMTIEDHNTFATNPLPMLSRTHVAGRHVSLPTLSVSFEHSSPSLLVSQSDDAVTEDAVAELFGARNPSNLVDAPPVARNLVALARDLEVEQRVRHETELVDHRPGVSAKFVVVAVLLLAAAFALGLGIPYLVLS